MSDGGYLQLDDRIRLQAAVAAVDVMHDPHQRQLALDELIRELGSEVSLDRDGDLVSIFRECERLGVLRLLAKVLRLVGGPGQAIDTLDALLDDLMPQSILTSTEQRRFEELMGEFSGAALAEVLADGELDAHTKITEPELANAVQRLQAYAGNDVEAAFSLLMFLECCSHELTYYNAIEAHKVIHAASLRHGLEKEVGDYCKQLSNGAVRNGQNLSDTGDPSAQETVMSTLVPSTSGEVEVRIPTLPTTTSDPVFMVGPSIMGGVPPQNPNFTGREAMLDELKRTLRQHNRAAVLPHTLQGLGGVGKSQLAIEYARRFQGDYELIWWIPADDDLSLRRSFLSLARRLNLPESDDVAYTVETVLDQLRIGRPTPNWLLIYDGTGEPGSLRNYLPSGSGHVLITSRSQSWVGQSTVIEVDVFTPEESVEFLTARWADIDVEDARRLAAELGHLPLALEQAVAVHMETGMHLPEYLRLLRSSPGQMLDEGNVSTHEHSVAKTWRLAFDELNRESPAAAQLLEVCSFLSSNPIAVPMLARGRGAALPTALAEALRDDMKMRKAVRDMGRYALAQLDTSRDFIKIHMLVRALVRDGLVEEKQAATERSAHELLALANPGTPDSSVTWSQHAQVAPHVIPSGVIMSDDGHVRRIVLDQIRYFFVIGDYASSEALARRAVETWHGSLGPNDESTLVASFHLGNALRALGKYQEAREINEHTLTQMSHVLGLEHENTMRMANSHAADLRLLGEFQQATEVDEENLARYRRVLGDGDPATLRSANNLAVDYRLAGDFRRARELDENTWQLRAGILGDYNPEVLSSASSVVRDRYGFGEYESALILATESLAKYEPLKLNHAFILLAKRNQAILIRKTGAYAEAAKVSEDVFEQSGIWFGPRHEHTLSAMMTLSNALRANNEFARALAVGRDALELYEEYFKSEHPFTLACASNLSIALRAVGDVEDAYARDCKTLEALERTLGADHPYSLCCASNLSNDLAMLDRNAEARAVSEKVLERSRHARVPDHPYTLACAANLALDLEAVGARSEASALSDDTKERMQRKLGSEHPETVNMERGRRMECDSEVPPS